MALSRPKFTRLRHRRTRGLAPDLEQFLSESQPGDVYNHPVAYSTDPLIGPPGFYGTDPLTHQIIPGLRLTVLPHTPNAPDPDGHTFIIADPNAPYYEHPPTNEVTLQAVVHGTATVEPTQTPSP